MSETTNTPSNGRRGGWIIWGPIAAIGAAVAASACCTLPLLLVTLGVGGAWMASLSALEPYRPVFIAAALVLLGLGFRRVYVSSQACEADAVCARPGAQRANKIALWIATIIVALFIVSPYVASRLLAETTSSEPAATKQVVLEVEGMTCAVCPITVRKKLESLDGVLDAVVTTEPPRAVVTFDPAKVSAAEISKATGDAGYPSKILEDVDASSEASGGVPDGREGANTNARELLCEVG